MCGRVMFFGDKGTSAGDVARCVLSVCACVSPPFTNVIRRAFPYASLTQLEFLNLKGCDTLLHCYVCHQRRS